jgi:hypothetical protein
MISSGFFVFYADFDGFSSQKRPFSSKSEAENRHNTHEEMMKNQVSEVIKRSKPRVCARGLVG